MRLAIYAHYGERDTIALHVLYFLNAIRALGFEVCFVSNSPVAADSCAQLSKVCGKVILRENTGLDFSMWKAGLKHYSLGEIEEVLLTNSSIVGPLMPLEKLWQNPALGQCDFWGLTNNEDIAPHIQSYFLVFRRQVVQSAGFAQFWETILPYQDKDQIIRSYEVGLTIWLGEQGFKWKTLCSQREVLALYLTMRKKQHFLDKWRSQLKPKATRRAIRYPGNNTVVFFPDVLIGLGLPFLKYSLLKTSNVRVGPQMIEKLLSASDLPKDVLAELAALCTLRESEFTDG